MSESSTDTAVDTTAETTPTPDANTAVESSAPAEGESKSIFDVVNAALQATDQEASPPSDEPGTEAQADDPSEGAAETLPDPTEEDLKRYKPATAQRMRQLLDQRDQSRAEVEKLQPKVQAFDSLSGFLQQNQLTDADLRNAVNLAAMVRNRPEQEFPKLLEIVQQMAPMVGAVLPDDLHQAVQAGKISEEYARELAGQRATAMLSQHRSSQTQEQLDQKRRQEAWQGTVQAVSNAATEWETSVRRTDPDYSLKQGRIAELVELYARRDGYPTTPQQAVEMSKKAYEVATSELTKFRPAPKPVRTVQASASPRQLIQNPRSVLDIINNVVGSGA